MYKILLVDDEIEIRYGLKHYFPWNDIGFEIAGECENGSQALEYINQQPVDVLLCDIQMPYFNGIELAKELSRRKTSIKIVFLSAHKKFEYAKQALSFGVVDYLVKPTKYKDLMTVFTKVKEGLDKDSLQVKEVPSITSEGNFDEKIISTIDNYVKEHYKTANLEEVAKVVHMSPNYLSKYFKEKTNKNFSSYLIDVKMNHAAKLLMDIHYKTYNVSEMVGYSNTKNFTRTFKKYFGVSPRDFRKGKNNELSR